MRRFVTAVQQFASEESGATMVEYALLAGLLGVAVIAALSAMSGRLTITFRAITEALPAAPSTASGTPNLR